MGVDYSTQTCRDRPGLALKPVGGSQSTVQKRYAPNARSPKLLVTIIGHFSFFGSGQTAQRHRVAAAAHEKLGKRNGIPNASGLSGLGGHHQTRADLLVCLFHPERQIDHIPDDREFAAVCRPHSPKPRCRSAPQGRYRDHQNAARIP